MLSNYIRAAQLVELVAYALVAYALAAYGRWSAGAAILAVAAVFIASRLFFTAASFALAWLHRAPPAPEHRIGLPAALAMVLREWRWLLAFNLLYVPWERAFLRPDPVPGSQPGRPVVLVHGYFANRGYFRPLVKRLEAAGFTPIFVPNLRSWHATIERFEAELSASLERIAGASGQRVSVIAHSMGGLGIRAHLARHGTRHVERIITIASPHHGTALGAFGVGINARQMCPDSAFLRELRAGEGKGPEIPVLSIYSTHDNMVAPQDSSRLPWARNVAVRGRGHLEVVHCDEVLALLTEELRREPGEG